MQLIEAFEELSGYFSDFPGTKNSWIPMTKNMSEPLQEDFTDRNTLINNIKGTGRNYNFDKWSDTNLYRMWQRIQQEEHNKKIARKILTDMERKRNTKYCIDCGTQLSDSGRCHKCDTEFGFEELDEGVFDGLPNTSNWVSMSTGNKVNTSNNNSKNSTISNKPHYVVSASANVNIKDSLFYWNYSYNLGDMNDLVKHQDIYDTIADAEVHANNIFNEPAFAMKPAVYIMAVDIVNQDFRLVKSVENPYQQQNSTNNIVTIVYDGNRLRAQADDGQNGKGWVAFPNNLRTKAGQQYEVDGLHWNGKNYRVVGNITPITNNNLRYVVSDRKSPDFNDKAFYYFDADPSTGKSKLYIGYLKYFEAGDFTYNMQQAVDKVKAVMREQPYSDLYLISIDENNKLELVKSYE